MASSVSIFPSEDELIVAEILLTLRPGPSLIEHLADSNWMRRKRRSCLDAIPPLPAPPPSQSPSIQRPENRTEDTAVRIRAEPAAEKGGDGDRATISPDSPFVFAPSDDERSSTKRNYSDRIEQLTQQKCFLRREIENVKKYSTKLKAYNSQLKSFQQEVSGGMMVEIGLTHQQPLIADPMAQEIQFPIGPIAAHSQQSNNGLGSVNSVGPFVFDLNLPAEEALGIGVVDELQLLDVNKVIADRRVRFAEARRMRKEIIKTKFIKNGVFRYIV